MSISYSGSIILMNIGSMEGCNQEEISKILLINKVAVARSVKNMVTKGYVHFEQDEVDKRAKKLYLTEAGNELLEYIDGLNRDLLCCIL